MVISTVRNRARVVEVGALGVMEGGLYDCDSGMLLEKRQPCRQEPCLRFYQYIILKLTYIVMVGERGQVTVVGM